MQDNDPNLPGYYTKRKVEVKEVSEGEEDEGDWSEEFDEDIDDCMDKGNYEETDGEEDKFKKEEGIDWDIPDATEGNYEETDGKEEEFKNKEGIDWDREEWESLFESEDDNLNKMDGFSPAGVGYGNITEETLERQRKEKVSKAERKRLARQAQGGKEEVIVCARCHSLRNYGQVKNQVVENLIPDFDFDRFVTTLLMKPTRNTSAAVVVMVGDCVDFDGSFTRCGAKSLFKALETAHDDSKRSKTL